MGPTDPTKGVRITRLHHLLLGTLLAGYFFYLNWNSLSVHFALDDLSNIRYYYNTSSLQLILSQFTPWRGDYRPMGGLFYLPIFHFAELNPVPYQAILLLLMLGNVYLVQRFADLLGAGEIAAYLAALLCCYHAGLANLYYNAAFVYDVLCGFFYLAAFTYYLRIRSRGRLLSTGQTIVFLLLFLCALNSKEMAVTLPVMIVIYELLYHPPRIRNWAKVRAWIGGPGRLVLVAGLLDTVDVYGKVAGPDAMANAYGYRPVFTLSRLYDFQKNLLQDLFLAWHWVPSWSVILATWALLAVLAWWLPGRRPLRFLFWFLVFVPLPIEFLPGKRGACFCLLMVGAGIFASAVLVDVSWAAARILSKMAQLPAPYGKAISAAIVLAAVVFWVQEQRHYQRDIARDQMPQLGWETWDLIQQFPKFPRPRPGSRVAFLQAPLSGNDMWGLALLWFHDKSVDVHVWTQGELSPQQLASKDHVYTFENRTLRQLR
jgi:hypothetical protein